MLGFISTLAPLSSQTAAHVALPRRSAATFQSKEGERHVVVTNLFQDTAGRRRRRDAGAVGMGEDAMRKEPLSNHGNSPAVRIWNEDFARRLPSPRLPPAFTPKRTLACEDVKDRR